VRATKKTTIREVAIAAGVSPAAVSRYLSRQIVLSAETGKRIDAAVETLGYRPNLMARRMSLGTNQIIGLVVSDIVYPFFSEMASAAEEEATRFGYDLIICNTRNQLDRELGFLDKLQARFVDGLLLVTNHADYGGELRTSLERCGHVVLLDEDVQGVSAPRIIADNFSGAVMATRELIEAGHTEIVHVTGKRGLGCVEERLAGYMSTVEEQGLNKSIDQVFCGEKEPYDFETGVRAFAELWSRPRPPSAIFAATDGIAMGILSAAREVGLIAGRDYSIVGFDDLPFSRFLDPPLTTIRQSAADFGKLGVRILVEMIKGVDRSNEMIRLPVELVRRGSVRILDKQGNN
jgi:LacI family transcriptional regulator